MNADAELPRTKLGEDWSALVSVGANIKLPGKLVSSRIGDVVAAIAYGHWAEQVDRVRKLRHGTSEQAPMKEKLPYWTPAGLFSYRSNKSLIRHSGHVGVDLDNLGKRGATRAVQIAVDDLHCVCAFRSASA